MLYLNRLFIFIITVSALLMINSFAYSAEKFEIGSLRGLKVFLVNVEELPDELKGSGLISEQIQTDVELKLRLAGIKVVSNKELYNLPAFSQLSIRVSVLQKEKYFAVFVELSLIQEVILKRNPKMDPFIAPTWRERMVGFVSENRLASIRDKVKDLMDSFINDYLSVNPKGSN